MKTRQEQYLRAIRALSRAQYQITEASELETRRGVESVASLDSDDRTELESRLAHAGLLLEDAKSLVAALRKEVE